MSRPTTESDLLAARGIALLVQAFERDFGLTLQIGAEQEYFCTDPSHPDVEDPLDLKEAETWRVGKPVQPRPRYYEGASAIGRHYKETPPYQYELVFDHRQFDDPVALCNSIMARREGLLRRSGRAGLEVSFSPVRPTGYEEAPYDSAGLQFVLSFTQADGAPLFPPTPWGATSGTQGLRRLHACNAVLREMQPYTLLTVGSEEAFLRFQTQNDGLPPSEFRSYSLSASGRQPPAALQWRNKHDAFEFRLPSADASPYQSMLLMLASWYAAFAKEPDLLDPAARGFGNDRRGFQVESAGRVAPDSQAALAQFAEASTIAALLNRLSDATLGDQWHAASLKDYPQRFRDPAQASARGIR